ncbi:MAG: magnesium transporter [Deltaproteobacteria bacterium]|nr:magnesium transporter [Deltaproteobacteria bacterium]
MATKIDLNLLRKAVRSGLLRRLLAKLQPGEIAPLLAELSPSELRAVVIELCRHKRLADTLYALPGDLLGDVISHLDAQVLGDALRSLKLDEATRLLRRLDESLQARVLSAAEPHTAQQLGRLLRYPPDSAGGRMLPSFVAVKPQTTVGEAISTIRSAGPDTPLFYLYVVGEEQQIVGVASLSQLVRTADDVQIGEIMAREVVAVSPLADQEEVARLVVRRNILAVPVVEDGKLLGLVTIDDVLEVLEQEATEDMYNMAGLSEGDRVFSSPQRSLLKRLPWNALNLGTSLIAATVVGFFEGTIDKLVALAVFMPVVAGIGGNTGNQTLTVIIRGITLGELEFSSAWRAMIKEIVVGLSIGVLLGGATAGIAYLWKGNGMLGLVVGMAMVLNLCIAALVGTAIPLSLKRFGLDPALGGSILVTMFTDVFGFLCFLGLATLFMPYLI